MREEDALNFLFSETENFNIVSLGYLSRFAFQYHHSVKNFYMTGSMGLALPFAIGLSNSSNKNFNVIIGEGSLFMNLGALSSSHLARNLNVILIDNCCHNSTGGQKTNFKSDSIRELSLKSGFESFNTYSDLKELQKLNTKKRGKHFHVLYVTPMESKPLRINIKLEDIQKNFKKELEKPLYGKY
ncbi:hypothetical protein GH131_10450 [Staphylococcus pseudintermedius]|nr:hypothetical protein [Staphylococcus pseudintermedius]